MPALQRIALLVLIYIGIIATFESLLGYFQPSVRSTLVITTADEDGTKHERFLARLESDGQLFVAVNHWPRAGYGRALENASVQVVVNGITGTLREVTSIEEKDDRVNRKHSRDIVFRMLTGFPSRYFRRLVLE